MKISILFFAFLAAWRETSLARFSVLFLFYFNFAA